MAPWTIAAVALLLNSAYLASTATASLHDPTAKALGVARAGMGVDAADFDGSGLPQLFHRGIVGRVPFAAQSLRSPTGPR